MSLVSAAREDSARESDYSNCMTSELYICMIMTSSSCNKKTLELTSIIHTHNNGLSLIRVVKSLLNYIKYDTLQLLVLDES